MTADQARDNGHGSGKMAAKSLEGNPGVILVGSLNVQQFLISSVHTVDLSGKLE